jgi:hypothetical protein
MQTQYGTDNPLSPYCFELSNLGQPPTVPICTAEVRAKEVLRAFPRNCDTGGSASEAECVQVVVLHALFHREATMI